MLNYVFRYKFSILVAAFIALLSLVPSSSIPDTSLFSIGFLDKIVHVSMYAFFAWVALLESRCPPPCRRQHLLMMGVIFLMSTLIEVLQATVVASRSAEWLDLTANLLGLMAGYVAYRMFLLLRS